MSYNILAQIDKKVDWKELNQKVMPVRFLEFVPMIGKGINGGDAIGISIPAKNSCIEAWEELKAIVYILANDYQFELYDLYHGAKIDDELLNQIKEQLIL